MPGGIAARMKSCQISWFCTDTRLPSRTTTSRSVRSRGRGSLTAPAVQERLTTSSELSSISMTISNATLALPLAFSRRLMLR
jgi:hypothetical protein